MYIYKYSRYYCPDEREHKTLAEALYDAYFDHSYGMAYGLSIINESGKTIMDKDELLEFYCDCSGVYDEINSIDEIKYKEYLVQYAITFLHKKGERNDK